MDFIMDLHTHTLASVHAYSTLSENARMAKEHGLEILGLSDHGYGMSQTTIRPYWSNLSVLPDYLEGVRILKGAEVNIKNNEGKIHETPLLDGRLDYVIASLHGNCFDHDKRDMQEYTDAVVNCLDRHPEINVLGHPDDSRQPLDYEAVIDAAIRNNVALEVNNSSLQAHNYRKDTRENMLKYLPLCKEKGCYIIVNSDAHMSTAVGVFDSAREVLEEVDFPEELIINTSWEKLEALIERKI